MRPGLAPARASRAGSTTRARAASSIRPLMAPAACCGAAPAVNTKTVTGEAVLTDINGAGWYALVGTSAGTVAAIDLTTGNVTWESAVLGDAIGSRVTVQYWTAS